MNGNENKNDQNNGLNAVSLGNFDGNQNLNGSINPINPSVPLDPVEPIESLDDSTPMMGEANTPNVPQSDTNVVPTLDPVEPIAPVEPLSYDIPDVMNTMPVLNDIGTIPPISNVPEAVVPTIKEDKPSKRQGINKTLFVIIILLALAMVGGGVYLLLNKANNRTSVVLKALKIEIGSEVSTNISDYASFKGIDSSTCSLDTSEITDTKVLDAKYKFKIICNEKTYAGTATIVDTVAPVPTLKNEVTIGVNETVEPGDFISECKDETDCSYEFKDKAKVEEFLKKADSYKVPILVKDQAGNEAEVSGTLIVKEEVSSASLICIKESDEALETMKFGLAGSNFNKITTRSYTYTFSTKTEYDNFKAVNANKTEVTYKNVTGSPEFDDENLKLTLTKNISYEELNKEAGSNVPTTYVELRGLYVGKGYQCKIGL